VRGVALFFAGDVAYAVTTISSPSTVSSGPGGELQIEPDVGVVEVVSGHLTNSL
jgi:hypothetical protein